MTKREKTTFSCDPNENDLEDSSKGRRRYLTQDEINALLWQAKKGRNPERIYCLILLSWRHGLRVSEAINLLWTDVIWSESRLRILREKSNIEQKHPLSPEEIRALKALSRKRTNKSPYIFTSQQGTAYTRQAILKMIKNLAIKAKIEVHVHPHMLRHTCGTMLAEKGTSPLVIKDYLGQKDIDSAMFYIHLSGRQFDSLGKWWD